MPTINVSTVKNDLFGGLTAAVVALPLALAFGVQSGMGAVAGLYGAIAIGIIAAWFGGTPTQISGPTGPMTVVSAVIIASAIERYGSLDAAQGSILAIFLLAGLFQMMLGFFRIGQYIRYMPYPVVSGFMSGIGVIIIVLQIFPFLGHPSPKSIIEIFVRLPGIVGVVNIYAVALSLATIVIIYQFPRISKAIPSPLVALILLTLASTFLNLNVAVIGDIPKGLPAFKLWALASYDWLNFSPIIFPAVTLAALGAIDSLLTSIVADNLTKTRHDSNQELIGQGLGNVGSALIGGIPGAGATMRTVVNIRSGGTTRLSGVIHGLTLLLVLLGAGTYAKLIPIPVLAGILITVGIGIVDYWGLKHLASVPRTDAVILIVVLFLTVFVDLLQAVAAGMVLACVLFMKKMSDIVESKTLTGSIADFYREEAWCDELLIPESLQDKIYIKHFDGPIFFGFASRFQEMIRELPDVKVVVLRMKHVPYIDQSGIFAIADAVLELQEKGVTVLITGIQEQSKDMLSKIGLIPDLVPEENIFEDFQSCIIALQEGKFIS